MGRQHREIVAAHWFDNECHISVNKNKSFVTSCYYLLSLSPKASSQIGVIPDLSLVYCGLMSVEMSFNYQQGSVLRPALHQHSQE